MGLVARSRLRRLVAVALLVGSTGAAGIRDHSTASGQIGEARAAAARSDAGGTVWLCRPGLPKDPCTADLDSTAVRADGTVAIRRARPAVDPPFDCYYVYPTVSEQRALNADLRVEPAETAVAVAQASRFSQVCRVWAPMYRQQTLFGLGLGLLAGVTAVNVAYQSALAGWQDYLAHANQGRPIVFIGHSQGASMLILLLRSQVDPNPELRRRVVSAIILGGNVTVPSAVGAAGSFAHLPACRSAGQFGCVIAYSSFPGRPPADTLFGVPGQGVSLQWGQIATAGVRVLCVNPAAPGGGSGRLDPYYPTADLAPAGRRITTPWVEYPDQYAARCASAGPATWLDVTTISPPGDPRPRVPQVGGPRWGYHVADVNLALGNLVQLVRRQEAAYLAARR